MAFRNPVSSEKSVTGDGGALLEVVAVDGPPAVAAERLPDGGFDRSVRRAIASSSRAMACTWAGAFGQSSTADSRSEVVDAPLPRMK
jgi:hypothetical protein